MSSKQITLELGGKHGFTVIKHITGEDLERFSVKRKSGYYDHDDAIIVDATWAEASQAMNKFKEEFEDAFDALVQISTLTPLGVHEES